MSNQIQLQSDVGALSIQGLAAFSTILATLSADNIVPTAMIQVQQLGAVFLTSGKFAEKVPDILQRFSSQPLGRFAVAIGWRKGDTASLLAASTAGQSIALVIVVLANLFRADECGEILFRLCSQLLPRESSVASMAQLADVAKLVAQKVFSLGFGNFLANEILRIHRVYDALGRNPPEGLLDCFGEKGICDLLVSISQALQDESKIVRISGSLGLGHIVGVALFLFPHDTMITIEDILVHEGERQKIHIELRDSPFSTPVVTTVETKVDVPGKVFSKIRLDVAQSVNYQRHERRFTWHGWIAKALDLAFIGIGATCTQEISIAFCNLLVATFNVDLRGCNDHKGYLPYIWHGSLASSLLGSNSRSRIDEVCQEVVLAIPTAHEPDLHTSFETFTAMIEAMIGIHQHRNLCWCSTPCSLSKNWLPAESDSDRCRLHELGISLTRIFNAALMCCFINSEPDASISVQDITDDSFSGIASEILKYGLNGTKTPHTPSSIYGCALQFKSAVAQTYGSTIYATALATLEIPPNRLASFELRDGRLMFENRYYEALPAGPMTRPDYGSSIQEQSSGIQPSSTGEHESLSMTILEKAWGIDLRTSVRWNGKVKMMGLFNVIRASFELKRTQSCSHPPNTPLKSNSHRIAVTNVLNPRAESGTLAIAMTKGNPTAQFLCCQHETRTLLMQECCLNCAVEEAIAGEYQMIIVT